jgi:Zn finger protein HypA/HybF involved in hydrogenase expression
MLYLECPSCDAQIEIDGEILPGRACDEVGFDCPHCDQEMKIGWRAEVEVRSVTVEYGDTVAEV